MNPSFKKESILAKSRKILRLRPSLAILEVGNLFKLVRFYLLNAEYRSIDLLRCVKCVSFLNSISVLILSAMALNKLVWQIFVISTLLAARAPLYLLAGL